MNSSTVVLVQWRTVRNIPVVLKAIQSEQGERAARKANCQCTFPPSVRAYVQVMLTYWLLEKKWKLKKKANFLLRERGTRDGMRYEVLMAANMSNAVFWVVMSLAASGYEESGEPYHLRPHCFHSPEGYNQHERKVWRTAYAPEQLR